MFAEYTACSSKVRVEPRIISEASQVPEIKIPPPAVTLKPISRSILLDALANPREIFQQTSEIEDCWISTHFKDSTTTKSLNIGLTANMRTICG